MGRLFVGSLHITVESGLTRHAVSAMGYLHSGPPYTFLTDSAHRECTEIPPRQNRYSSQICLANHRSGIESDSSLPIRVTEYVPSVFLRNCQMLPFIEAISAHGHIGARWLSLTY